MKVGNNFIKSSSLNGHNSEKQKTYNHIKTMQIYTFFHYATKITKFFRKNSAKESIYTANVQLIYRQFRKITSISCWLSGTKPGKMPP